jgi:hypothetical protein
MSNWSMTMIIEALKEAIDMTTIFEFTRLLGVFFIPLLLYFAIFLVVFSAVIIATAYVIASIINLFGV